MKKRICLAVVLVAVLVLVVWTCVSNSALELNVITVQEETLPADFDGFRIAHISDFHSAGNMADKVVSMLQEAKPDIICITGDLIDSRDKNVDVALSLVERIAGIAQCYFVAGNHEYLISPQLRDTLLEGMAELGVILVIDGDEKIKIDDSEIAIVGNHKSEKEMIPYLSTFEGYKILMSHYPEDYKYFIAGEYDLVLTGHTHGGQFRLPFIGGVYAPGQGIFPKYDAGLFTKGCLDMVVNRGIGNSTIPFRFNNCPEVILVELKSLSPNKEDK